MSDAALREFIFTRATVRFVDVIFPNPDCILSTFLSKSNLYRLTSIKDLPLMHLPQQVACWVCQLYLGFAVNRQHHAVV